MIIGTILGWIWNWLHYNMGVAPAWVFPFGEVIGISILGIPIEDWLFYPITGGFFSTIVMVDPLKIFGLAYRRQVYPKFYYNAETINSPTNIKIIIQMCLVGFTCFMIVYCGKSGTLSALFFGLPAIFMFCYILDEWNVWHFLRTGIIVVPTNVIWDIWATPEQWLYPKDTGMFAENFWYLGIPFEMTPGLGILAWFFVFSLVISLKKANNIR